MKDLPVRKIRSKATTRAEAASTIAGFVLLVWIGIAYGALPLVWRHYEHERGLDGRAMVTRTGAGIPGDPINIGLVGSEKDIVCAFDAAGWSPANPVTLASSIRIIGSVVLDRPYPAAPVSPLYYDGRPEDLAFQKPEGVSADTRHHVRFWHVLDKGEGGREVWLGSASFDRGVGLSHYTLQVTHHIAPDVDAERDYIIGALVKNGAAQSLYEVSGIGPTIDGRNGGDDRYFTDGEVKMAVLAPDCARQPDAAPDILPNPMMVTWKNKLWGVAKRWF